MKIDGDFVDPAMYNLWYFCTWPLSVCGPWPFGVSPLPAGEGVGGEAAVDQGDVGLILRVLQIQEVLPQLTWIQLALKSDTLFNTVVSLYISSSISVSYVDWKKRVISHFWIEIRLSYFPLFGLKSNTVIFLFFGSIFLYLDWQMYKSVLLNTGI